MITGWDIIGNDAGAPGNRKTQTHVKTLKKALKKLKDDDLLLLNPVNNFNVYREVGGQIIWYAVLDLGATHVNSVNADIEIIKQS